MWDLTHTCHPIISPSRVSLPFYELQNLFVGHEQVLLTPSYLMGFSFHQRVIHRSLVRHPWEPRVNTAHPCPWEPRITPLFSTISNVPSFCFCFCFLFFFVFLFFCFRIFVCGPFRFFLPLLGRDYKHLTTFSAHYHGF